MNQRKFVVLLFIFILRGWISSFAQNQICICASYSSLKFETNYENVFPHKIIKSEKIKEVIVYTNAHTTTDSSKQLLPEKYIEEKIRFDENGYVKSRVFYYLGKPNDVDEFERDPNGNIIKKTFTYVDSLEHKLTFVPPKITEYTYDNSNRLIKEKGSDYNGKMLPDEKSSYTKYEYAKNGKLILTTGQSYFDSENIWKRKSTYQYSNDSLMRICQSIQKEELYSTDTSIYDRTGKMLSENDYSNPLNVLAFSKIYKYDSQGRLLIYEQKNGTAGGSECPDNGTYIDQYFYANNGLVEKIINSYGIYNCEMRIEYLK